jgi:hypothetical protein
MRVDRRRKLGVNVKVIGALKESLLQSLSDELRRGTVGNSEANELTLQMLGTVADHVSVLGLFSVSFLHWQYDYNLEKRGDLYQLQTFLLQFRL